MDADIEIGVVADAEGQVHLAIGSEVQAGRDDLLPRRIGQQGEYRMTQEYPRTGWQGEQCVQRRLRQRGMCRGGQGIGQPSQVQHIIADRGANPRACFGPRKHPQRQVLHREVSMFVGTGNPA